jgi:hypothetical protein
LSSHSNNISGYRKIAKIGSIQDTTYTLNLPPGNYYWSVQAIDAGLMGGAWSAEQSFSVAAQVNGTNEDREAIEEKVRLFPNPVTQGQNITLHLDGLLADNAVIYLYDMMGRLVLQKTLLRNGTLGYTLPVKGLKAGLYQVRIKNSNQNISKKIVIQQFQIKTKKPDPIDWAF